MAINSEAPARCEFYGGYRLWAQKSAFADGQRSKKAGPTGFCMCGPRTFSQHTRPIDIRIDIVPSGESQTIRDWAEWPTRQRGNLANPSTPAAEKPESESTHPNPSPKRTQKGLKWPSTPQFFPFVN